MESHSVASASEILDYRRVEALACHLLYLVLLNAFRVGLFQSHEVKGRVVVVETFAEVSESVNALYIQLLVSSFEWEGYVRRASSARSRWRPRSRT